MTRRPGVILAAAILLAVCAAAPALAANKEHQQMMADLRMLQLQTQALQAHLVALTETLKVITSRLDEQAGTSRKASADARAQADALAGDLRVVREKVDETNVRLSSLSQEVEALRVAQYTAPAATPAQPPGGEAVAGQPPPTGPPPPAALGPGLSPQRMFDQSRGDYYAGNWSLAIAGFETYIKTFPRADLADDAQYYIGETHYSSGKFREAIAAYDRVIANHPDSNTLPDVYYKRGLSYNSLGQIPQARESFEFVVKNYGDSDAGRLAKQALDRLNRNGR